METFITYTIQGLAFAAVYAIAASGLVVTYTTSGIFNFAHGAFGMMAAFTYWQLSADPDKGGFGISPWIALPLMVLVIAPLFGAVVERVIMRGLDGASEVVKIVVTVSLMLAMLGAANWIWPGDRGRSLQRFLPGEVLDIAGVRVPYHRIVLTVVAIVVAGALRLVLFKTRVGVAMRAVVDDRALAQLNGVRPARVSMMAWGLGSSLAALSGILVAPERFEALALTLLVVNAYAAAVVGRLRSLPMTFVGALILGLAEAYSAAYLTGGVQIGDFDLTNLQFAVSPILLFLVMVLQPQARLRAGGIQRVRESWRVPTIKEAAIGGAVLVVVVIGVAELIQANIADPGQGDAALAPLIPGLFFALVALSLVPLTGFAGQISLAQMSFVGIGAVVMGRVADSTGKTPAGLLLALIISGLLGALIALPALRLTGIYLALGTAAFSLFLTQMVFNQSAVMEGGRVAVPGLDLGLFEVRSNRAQITLLAVVFALVGTFIVWLRRSSFGRRLTAMKDSPVACATLGLDLTQTKIGVFALSASIAGLAGALYNRTVTPEEFQLTSSMGVTMLAVVGGVGAVSGALFGGVLLGTFNNLIPAVLKNNAIGLFRFIEVSVPDFMRVAPGMIGISLGRDPSGAAPQIAEGFRPLVKSRVASGIAIGGIAGFWLLARSHTISNWTFVACMTVIAFAVLPLLPVLVAPIPGGRAAGAGALLVAALVGVASIEWNEPLGSLGLDGLGIADSVGLRVVLMAAITAVAAWGAIAVHGAVPGMDRSSAPAPDLIGIDRPLRASDALDAERVVGVVGLLDRSEPATVGERR